MDTDSGVGWARTLNPVLRIMAGDSLKGRRLREAIFAHVAPTLLEALGMDEIAGTTGQSVLV